MLDRFCNRPINGVALLACCWLAAPSGVFAEGLGPDPRSLGVTESILSYCAKVDAAAAAKYQESVRQLTDGASDEVLAKVRGSDEYRRARQSMEDFVKTVDEHNAKQLCSNGLAPHR
jgi:hypothetical protein